jgi:phosphatidate cytidylyltransferase
LSDVILAKIIISVQALNNLTQRIFTAVIGAAVLLSAVIYGEQTFLLILLLVSSLSLLEFYKLAESDECKPQKILGLIINFVIFLQPVFAQLFFDIYQIDFNIIALIIILPFIIFIRELFKKSGKPLYNIGITMLGIVYISLPLFLFYMTSFKGVYSDYQWRAIIGYFFILWANDTGAYVAGRTLGKHKLFERISPKKTWEGFFGGLILALVVAHFVSEYFLVFSKIQWLVISLIIVVTGTLGDLVESLFKRSVQLKDSGSILPGHGGFLDRFDGLLISAPFVFFYLQLGR